MRKVSIFLLIVGVLNGIISTIEELSYDFQYLDLDYDGWRVIHEV